MTGRLDPPPHFDGPRRQLWAATITRLTELGRVFAADPNVIATYVEAVMSHQQASTLLAQTGVLITRGDTAVENPALMVQRRTAEMVAKASRALGLNRTPMTEVLAESPMRGDGARWCQAHQRRECKHHRKDGGDCHAYQLIPGLGSCKKHCGLRLEDARAKGREALARLYSSAPMEIGTGEALLWEMQHSAAHVQDLRARVGELAAGPGPDGRPGSGLFWGTVRETETDGVLTREHRAGPHPVLKAYDAEREHLVRAALAANTAGAQAAQADAARLLGASVNRLLDACFAALDLADWQRELIPQRIPGVLRSWDPGPAAELTP